jgi:hypothetical protein
MTSQMRGTMRPPTSTVRSLGSPEWEDSGRRALRRLALTQKVGSVIAPACVSPPDPAIGWNAPEAAPMSMTLMEARLSWRGLLSVAPTTTASGSSERSPAGATTRRTAVLMGDSAVRPMTSHRSGSATANAVTASWKWLRTLLMAYAVVPWGRQLDLSRVPSILSCMTVEAAPMTPDSSVLMSRMPMRA